MRLPAVLLLALLAPGVSPAHGQDLPDPEVVDSTAVCPLERLTDRFDPAPGLTLCGNYLLVHEEPDPSRNFIVVFLQRIRGAREFHFPTRIEAGNLLVWVDVQNRVPRGRVRLTGSRLVGELWLPSQEVKGCRWLEMRVTARFP